MKTKNFNVLTKGEETYLTPPYILDALQFIAFGSDYLFDLDPACPPQMPWKTATTMLTKAEDGLSQKWYGHVWLNPPYGKETQHWVKKLSEHNDGMALIFARTDTQWFQDYVLNRAHGIFFFRGRLKFFTADGQETKESAPAPSCIAAYGHTSAYMLAVATRKATIKGTYINLSHARQTV